MKRFLTASLALLALAVPITIQAQSRPGTSAHMRPALFHDRSPRPHVHIVQPHH